jgi:DNA polymerase I-like protein with 3'-5' exonuclease and polymerase domains
LTKKALVKIDKVKDILLATAVHDSILSQVEEGNAEARTQMLRAMIDAGHELGFKVPMGVSWGRGPTWGEATFKEEGTVDDAVEEECVK